MNLGGGNGLPLEDSASRRKELKQNRMVGKLQFPLCWSLWRELKSSAEREVEDKSEDKI